MTAPDPLEPPQFPREADYVRFTLCHSQYRASFMGRDNGGNWVPYTAAEAKLAAQAEQIAALQAQLTTLREAVEPYLVGQAWLDYRWDYRDCDMDSSSPQTMAEHRALAKAVKEATGVQA